MGQLIIKCPDSKLALWSTVVDAFITEPLTREEMIDDLIEIAKGEATYRVDKAIAAGGECARDITYAECVKTQRRVHGNGGRSP